MTNDIRVGLIGAGFIGQMHSLSLADVSKARRTPAIRPELRVVAERETKEEGVATERFASRNYLAVDELTNVILTGELAHS